MSGGRFLLAVCLVVVLGVSPAAAFPRLHHRSVSSVRVVRDGVGTFISVTFSGHRTHTRVLRVDGAVDAVAIRRVDGHRVGIFAATAEGRLLLWTQSGRGKFVQAALPPRTFVLTHAAGLWPTNHEDGPAQLGDVRDTAALLVVFRPALHTAPAPRVSCDAAFVTTSRVRASSGRAPPRAA